MKRKLLYTVMVMAFTGASVQAAGLCDSICSCVQVTDTKNCPVVAPGECCKAGATTTTAQKNYPCGTSSASFWDPGGITFCNDWCYETSR